MVLQKLRLDVIKAWVSVSASENDREGQDSIWEEGRTVMLSTA